jgi:DNA polymerase-3 subunit gamma/tau
MRQRYEEQAKRCKISFLYDALKLMNQCDINYRQSSNKRLLVELTLIQVAQITQPAEEGASAGRKPRRLKSLFKNLIQQSQPKKTTAPQVAAAERAVSTPAVNSAAKAGGITSQPAPATTRTISGIGFSWNKLGQKDSPKKSGMQIIPGSINLPTGQDHTNDAQFSQTDLEFQWMSMCNRMPQKLSGIATRMKNMNPTITDFPAIEIMVDNDLIKQEIEDIKGSITKTLQIYLHNNQLHIEVIVSEQQEMPKILSRREQYEEMAENNPAVAKLQQALDLELA